MQAPKLHRTGVRALLAGAAFALSLNAQADAITEWNAKVDGIIAEAKVGTPPAIRVMAIVQTAAHDAVVAAQRGESREAAVAAAPAFAGDHTSPNDLFVVKTSAKSPEAVYSAIKSYVADKKWLYLGDNKVKNGEVMLVKLCVPSVAKDIWAAGLRVSALAPCGHLGIYQEAGQTKVSMLHPKFMNALNPHPSLKKVGDELAPLFVVMLDEVTR